MERVDIKVGFYCNNQCTFCVQGRKRDKLPAKSVTEVEQSLREAREAGKTEVVLTGGEPCMHPQFLQLVKIAHDLGFEQIQIQTNGRMFAYPDFCIKTIAAGATQFSPALHGSTALIHDFLTDAPRSYEQTVQGIKNLKSLGQYVLTNTVITSKNYQDLPNIARLLVELGVDQFQFAFVHILGTADKNKDWLVPRKTDIAPFVREGLEIGKAAGKKVTAEAIPYCLMTGVEDCVAEEIMPKTRIYDAGFVIPDYGEYRVNRGKVKGPQCTSCRYDNVCEGPWREYVELFGFDEFIPIK